MVILAIALVVIGPKKLPDLAKSLGRAMREFKKATSELKESMDLNEDLKDAKTSFDRLQGDLKGSFKDTPNVNGASPSEKEKIEDLEEAYRQWKAPSEPAEPPQAEASRKEPSNSDGDPEAGSSREDLPANDEKR